MIAGQDSSADRAVGRAELLARVAELTPLIEETATQSEALGTLVPELVSALRGAGLFRLWSARDVGGYDVDLADQLEILAALARADMSTCWSLMIGASSSSIMAARLPDEGVAELFADGQWPTAASSLMPAGRARRSGDGYQVSGRWGFGSGIRHAVGVMANCLVENGDGGKGARQISAFVPIDDVEILDDWNVGGLRGTGSNSYVVDNVFVPDRFIAVLQPLTVYRGGARAAALPLRLPIEHGAVALGGARRALDEVTRQAAGKRRLSEARTVADTQSFQVDLGRMEAQYAELIAGARASAVQFDAALSGPEAELNKAAADMRAVCAHVTEACQTIASRCLRHAGAGAIMPGNPLERLQRDMTVAAQHYMVGDSAYEALGRLRLGIDP
jgi:alkylation response protein AidB-like acyl-CoA dehydrogenase